MRTKVETVTPNKAKKLLSENTINRPLSKKRVEHYASLMEGGKWKLTHQGISIADDGTIIDGQHRLHAIIECNLPIDINISYGAEKETFKYIDVGYTRTTSNIFAIEGIKNYSKHSSGISRYHNFINSDRVLSTSNSGRVENHYTHEDYLQFYYDHEDFLVRVHSKITSLYDMYRILSTSELYAFYVYCVIDAGWSETKVESFFDNLYMIRHDAKSNVPKMLFNKLIQDATGTTEMKPQVKTALIIKSFNYFVNGKSLKRLYFHEDNENFPSVQPHIKQ